MSATRNICAVLATVLIFLDFGFAQRPELIVQTGHSDVISSICFSPDGKYIASGSYDRTVKLWTADGKEIRTFAEHTGIVTSVDFSPDGKYIVSGCAKPNEIILWEVESGELFKSFKEITESKQIRPWFNMPVKFSPDGERVAAGTDKGILVWDITSGASRTIGIDKWYRRNYPKPAICFSPDGKYIVSAVRKRMSLINAQSGTKERGYKVQESYIMSIDISSDGKYLVSATKDGKIKLWDIFNSKPFKILKTELSYANSVCFSQDDKYIAACSKDNKLINILESNAGVLLKKITVPESYSIEAIEFHPNNNNLIASAGGSISIPFMDYGVKIPKMARPSVNSIDVWNISSGEKLSISKGKPNIIRQVQFSPDKNSIIINNKSGITNLWQVLPNNSIHRLSSPHAVNSSAAISPDGKYIASSIDSALIILNRSTNETVCSYTEKEGSIGTVKFSPDGTLALNTIVLLDKYVHSDWENYFQLLKGISLVDLQSCELKNKFMLKKAEPDLAFSSADITMNNQNVLLTNPFIAVTWRGDADKSSPNHIIRSSQSKFIINDKYLLTAGLDNNLVYIYDYATKRIVKTFWGHYKTVLSVSITSDDKFIVSSSADNTIKIWRYDSGEKLPQKVHEINDMIFIHPTDYNQESASRQNTIIEIEEPKFLKVNKRMRHQYGKYVSSEAWKTLRGHTAPVLSVALSSDDKYIISGGEDGTVKIWDFQQGIELASLVIVNENDWVVTTPNGNFDASPGAMDLMYFVSGLEIIELNQLKERYYEPSLLQKILGFNIEPVRDVTAFENVLLYPEVNLSLGEEKSELNIHLTNRGGGIGKTVIYINGKEVLADARGEQFDSKAEEVTLTTSIKEHPFLIPGQKNEVMVKAYNAEGYLVSRGVIVEYTPPDTAAVEIPNLYILACGVSNYTGSDIDLRFPSKDATDISNALEVGAKRLFGVNQTFAYVLTSDSENKATPSKQNIINSFEDIAQKAKSTDILVVYLAGHGINWGGQDGDFYFLTQDAYTANPDAYNDPAIRQSSTLSSEELVNLVKQVPALKQVFIIDACASGRIVDDLVARRDAFSSTTIRAFDRMKDRTGMHIITGSAADAVSYEASRYGQGVLTYSLLEGIKGAALRESRFVDVSSLFQWARDRVPELAAGIGGIQEPRLFSPYGSESFDIGQMEDEDKAKVHLAKVKPMFVRSTFINVNESEDDLLLSGYADDQLYELSARGGEAPLVFLDVSQFPDACKVSGTYSRVNNQWKLSYKIKCGDKDFKSEIASASEDELKKKLIEVVNEVVRGL